MLHTGVQATALGRAVNEVNRMVKPLCLAYRVLESRSTYIQIHTHIAWCNLQD